MRKRQYSSALLIFKLFNAGDNVPGQMKESSLTFLVTGSEGRDTREGGSAGKIIDLSFLYRVSLSGTKKT